MDSDCIDLILPGALRAGEWRRIGELLAVHWPEGFYYDDTVPDGALLPLAGPRLHYWPREFVVVKDEASAYAAEHGGECSCLIHFRVHPSEGVTAVVDAQSEGEELAQLVLDTLHRERPGAT